MPPRPRPTPRSSAIGDHAVLGDCRSAALVSRHGSVDWLCWPRFDSPSVFGALLDPRAGAWTLAPTEPFQATRRYVDQTNVLETRFDTGAASATVTDLFPVASEEDKRRLLLPENQLLRIVECQRGEVEIESRVAVRPRYGAELPRIRLAGADGVRLEARDGLFFLRAGAAVQIDGQEVCARRRLRAGDRWELSLTFASDAPAVLPPGGAWARAALARTLDWWQRWAARIEYDGPERDAVVRSALALRLLFYAPSGAIVAAPTTSLPERIGGPLNWDYRYCWLRDASLTVRALFGLGCHAEAQAFIGWLLHSTRLTQPELRILYDVYGNAPPRERELAGLAGYAGSRPVRVGNAAVRQLQLDVYGEVIDAVAQLVRRGGALDRPTRRLLAALSGYVAKSWQQPDEGIWEPRSGKSNHTHSRLLCWTALDRAVELAQRGMLDHVAVDVLARERDRARRELEERAWNPRLGSYVSELDGDDVDAALLLLGWYGFEDAASERMRGTYRRVRERLGARRHLLYRYRSPTDSPGEGAFGICSFWGVEHLARGGGTLAEAEAAFADVCSYGNDLGLFAEEMDPDSGEALGNFPQGFTHVGLINAALSLAARRRREAARS